MNNPATTSPADMRHPAWCQHPATPHHGADHGEVATTVWAQEAAITTQLIAGTEGPVCTDLAVTVDSNHDDLTVRFYLNLTEVRQVRDALTAHLDRAEHAELDDHTYYLGGTA